MSFSTSSAAADDTSDGLITAQFPFEKKKSFIRIYKTFSSSHVILILWRDFILCWQLFLCQLWDLEKLIFAISHRSFEIPIIIESSFGFIVIFI